MLQQLHEESSCDRQTSTRLSHSARRLRTSANWCDQRLFTPQRDTIHAVHDYLLLIRSWWSATATKPLEQCRTLDSVSLTHAAPRTARVPCWWLAYACFTPWSSTECPVCTFLNGLAASACAMCNTPLAGDGHSPSAADPDIANDERIAREMAMLDDYDSGDDANSTGVVVGGVGGGGHGDLGQEVLDSLGFDSFDEGGEVKRAELRADDSAAYTHPGAAYCQEPWNCPGCTYANPPQTAECQMCSTENPVLRGGGADGGAGQPDDVDDEGTWCVDSPW